jgi:aspartate/methionine/tyrosine aminotransferase
MPDRHLAKKFQNVGGGSLALDTAALSRYDDIIDLSIAIRISSRTGASSTRITGCLAGYNQVRRPEGRPMLVEAIRNAYREDFGMELSPAEVFITRRAAWAWNLPDGDHQSGDEVLVFSPYFSPYKDQIELAGGAAVDVPTAKGMLGDPGGSSARQNHEPNPRHDF